MRMCRVVVKQRSMGILGSTTWWIEPPRFIVLAFVLALKWNRVVHPGIYLTADVFIVSKARLCVFGLHACINPIYRRRFVSNTSLPRTMPHYDDYAKNLFPLHFGYAMGVCRVR